MALQQKSLGAAVHANPPIRLRRRLRMKRLAGLLFERPRRSAVGGFVQSEGARITARAAVDHQTPVGPRREEHLLDGAEMIIGVLAKNGRLPPVRSAIRGKQHKWVLRQRK